MNRRWSRRAPTSLALCALFFGAEATAQAAPAETPAATETPAEAPAPADTPAEAPPAADQADEDEGGPIETVVITATKRRDGQSTQDAPLAVTAFGAPQLDALQFRDIESLSFTMPNVSLDDVGTAKGVANFSIRGLGINSSIPSIDPTVGVFVNGVYLGINQGVVLDTFDLEAIEVLRGPQGVLFGRNVTGGAVVLRTRRPDQHYGGQVKYNLELSPESDGLEHRVAGGIDLPLVDDMLAVRVSGSLRKDEGWFTNDFDDSTFGAADAWMVRPTIVFTPTDDIRLDLTFEHHVTATDGAAAQNRETDTAVSGDMTGFTINIDEPGEANYTVDFLSAELNWDLGELGLLTNVFGWRTLESDFVSDIDARNAHFFHGSGITKQDQISNELRYFGQFADRVDLTAGVYFFQQSILYRERRNLLGVATMMPVGAIDSTFGGDQEQTSLGAFANTETHLFEGLSLLAGVRYTMEDKAVKIATFNPMSPCGVLEEECTFDFEDDNSWSSVSPKVGLQYRLDDDTQVYGHWTRGFRSGGYNFRNTSPTASPGPFDEEQQDAYELGAKTRQLDGKLNISLAGFLTQMADMQREVNVPDDAVGVVQVIDNTADATIYGVEADVSAQLFGGLTLLGSLGIMRSSYDEVRYDLDGDGMVGESDKELSLPRFPELTATAGMLYQRQLGDLGIIRLRGNYGYRDETYFTDNNLGVLPGGHVIDAGLGFTYLGLGQSAGVLPTLTLYGRNLANTVFLGGQTPLPPMLGPLDLGGNFSVLKEGRVIGVELKLEWSATGG